MITHRLRWEYATPGLSNVTELTASDEGENNRDVVVPANSTDLLVAYTLDYSQCKGFFLLADANMTIETNSSSAPAQTITLTANVPVAWMTGAGVCPITADVTALYVTSVAGGNLTIRSLIDATV